MTDQEAITKARDIARGSNCFFHQRGSRWVVFRRVGSRVVPLGYRSNPAQLCAYLRRLTATH